MEIKVLVLGVGSNVSQGIVKTLREIKGIDIHIIGACVSKSSVGLYLCDEAFLMPYASDEKFVDWYIKICNENKIDISFTGVEENIDILIKKRTVIENKCNTKFVFPSEEAWSVGSDKYQTCIWLRDNGISYPDFALASDEKEVSSLIERVGFPLVAKPRKGKSSASVTFASTYNDLKNVIGNEEYVVEENVGKVDGEYTVGCYFSKTGKLESKIVMHRYLKHGSTSMAEIVQDEQIDNLVEAISTKLKTVGPLNLQIRKRRDGTPVCFEWNVRYSGTTAIRNHFGFKDVEAAIREYVLGEKTADCFDVKKQGVAIRFESELYYDSENFENLFDKLK